MANSAYALRSFEHSWQPASELPRKHHEPAFPPLQLSALNSWIQSGLPRGIIAEVNGRKSTGRTSFCLHVLAEATRLGEVCAVVDLTDNFHPASAAAANVRTDQLVWVRSAGNAEHAIKATDLILHAGGFGVVLLDLCEATPRTLNRIPLSYWYRFRKAVENTPTILLICAFESQAKSTSSFNLELISNAMDWTGKNPFLRLKGAAAKAIWRKGSRRQPEPFPIRWEA